MALVILWIVSIFIQTGHGKCINATEIRDKSVLSLTGTNILSLSGNWYVVSSYDETQPSYHGLCTCTYYNLTVHSNFEEDDLYHSKCDEVHYDGDIHFKGRFNQSIAGLWYELFEYDATDQVDIIDYQLVSYKNSNGQNTTSQTLIRYSCLNSLLDAWTSEVWSKKSDVPKDVIQKMLNKFPSPINTTSYHMNNQSECTF